MSNSIKYNASPETLSLNTGNFWIGTGDVGKGPTDITGFWNAINPPVAGGGYTIYVNKAIQGPSIMVASNDAELIVITNEIAGTTYTTINECFNYFIGQSDKFVLNSYIYPIITEELKFYSDASLVPSYPKNGTSWYDLSGEGNNGTLTNGPTFNSNGYLVFDGVDDYVGASGVGISNYSEAFSMGVWFKVDSTATWDNDYKSNIYSIAGSYNGQYGLFKSNDDELGMQLRDANSTIIATVSGNSKGVWYNLISTWDGSSTLKLYLNGELVDTNTAGGITGTPDSTNLHIAGKRAFGGAEGNVFEGDIAICNYYKKELSSNEVLQNYYQSKIVTDGLVFALDPGNLVSYEDGSTTTYSLTGSLNGSLTNGTGYSSEAGGVFIFDGNDDRINNFSEDIEPAIISIEYWKKWTTVGDDWLIGNQTSDPIDNNNGWYHRIDTPSENFFARFGVGSTSRSVTYNPIVPNEWTHIVTTFDPSEGVKLYWNGALVATNTNGGTLSYTSVLGLEIGGANDGTRDTPGPLGPVRIYNRALTAGEVSQNYTAQSVLFKPPAIAPQA